MKRFLVYLVVLLGVVYLAQALVVFPGMWASPKIQFWKKLKPSPNGVERFLVATPDEEELEVWFLPAVSSAGTAAGKPRVALFFHNEDTSLRTSFGVQKWLAAAGIASYAFDYRGFGASSGWPSEKGMIEDGQTVFQRILDREKAWPEDVILIGDSAGAAIASELAGRHRSRSLVLLAPFTSYAESLGVGAAAPHLEHVLRFHFPTAAYLEQISGACVVVAGFESGNAGRAIDSLAERAKGKNSVVKLVSSTSFGTGELLRQFKAQLQAALSGCAGA